MIFHSLLFYYFFFTSVLLVKDTTFIVLTGSQFPGLVWGADGVCSPS